MKSFIDTMKKKYRDLVFIIQNPPVDRKERYRKLLLFISVVCIVDYLAFSYLADKNIFNVFPSLPVLDTRDEIVVYLPDLQTSKIMKENRMITRSDDTHIQIRELVKIVSRGSKYENTAILVPVDLLVRKVWIEGDTCVVDLGLLKMPGNATIIDGSEKAFQDALSRTIKENIDGISRVILLENGIPGKRLWDLSETAYF
ncbi:MAG: hypothetical protein ACOCX9_02465 [Spirochaetota bacterium]